jgi:IS605 OrfB family transposase
MHPGHESLAPPGWHGLDSGLPRAMPRAFRRWSRHLRRTRRQRCQIRPATLQRFVVLCRKAAKGRRAEHRQHLRDQKGRHRAAAQLAPKPGQHGSRRWRRHRKRQRKAEARHSRRIRQARHEGARAGRRHNKRVRDWGVGQFISALTDKAEVAGIKVKLVDERGTSSTCPRCCMRIRSRHPDRGGNHAPSHRKSPARSREECAA